ncbi:uncharacterized protein E0L32_005590 [Thyridium curvatum]|uniref:Rpr2-domain-containing protein n=1 Tax=Thyridium curvatum TaxID=1093900 RepID=A0A507BBB5_9PEZI|nr:uncharacterized protein E0L32_005590 [Thyridium curvatum]TPX13890.1 hypothetical protein E0L32_005590 [Thyridium curvatum]
MAKGKTPVGVHNKHLYSRLSFLYQAAAHLAEASSNRKEPAANDDATGKPGETRHPAPQHLEGVSRRLATDFRAVGLKTQIRASPSMKRTICKSCDTFLIEGQTCTSAVENKSKNGRKPWADTLVISCNTCGAQKRFPVDSPRQRRKSQRRSPASGQVTVPDEKVA